MATYKDNTGDNIDVKIVDPPSSFKSPVWKHFGFPSGEQSVTICRICFDRFSYKIGSTAMSFHLKRKYNDEHGQETVKSKKR